MDLAHEIAIPYHYHDAIGCKGWKKKFNITPPPCPKNPQPNWRKDGKLDSSKHIWAKKSEDLLFLNYLAIQHLLDLSLQVLGVMSLADWEAAPWAVRKQKSDRSVSEGSWGLSEWNPNR